MGYYTKDQYDQNYSKGYSDGLTYAKNNITITLYLLSTKNSSTGLNEGKAVTITANNAVTSRTWGNAIASSSCSQNNDYGSMLWVTEWK